MFFMSGDSTKECERYLFSGSSGWSILNEPPALDSMPVTSTFPSKLPASPLGTPAPPPPAMASIALPPVTELNPPTATMAVPPAPRGPWPPWASTPVPPWPLLLSPPVAITPRPAVTVLARLLPPVAITQVPPIVLLEPPWARKPVPLGPPFAVIPSLNAPVLETTRTLVNDGVPPVNESGTGSPSGEAEVPSPFSVSSRETVPSPALV